MKQQPLTPETAAVLVMKNSTAVGDFCGFELRVSELMPDGTFLIGHPERPQDAVWITNMESK